MQTHNTIKEKLKYELYFGLIVSLQWPVFPPTKTFEAYHVKNGQFHFLTKFSYPQNHIFLNILCHV